MKGAFIALTAGGVLIYSGLKGQGILDVLSGKPTIPFDPAGGRHLDLSQGASATSGGSPGSGGTRAVSAGVDALVAECDRMIALRQPYKWGGGHAAFTPTGPWDCSGAESWLMHYAGLLSVDHPITSTGFMSQGVAGKGELFTIYANPTHVFTMFESGKRAGWCWGTTSRIASQGGSLRWHKHTTAGFTARHYPGH